MDAQYKNEKPIGKNRPKSLYTSFGNTNLDLENPLPLGGPNRTNSNQIPSGQYNTPIPGNEPFQAPSPGGVLKNKEGEVVKTQLQRWTKDNKYLDSFDANGNQNI